MSILYVISILMMICGCNICVSNRMSLVVVIVFVN